jgi:hypothetical protein
MRVKRRIQRRLVPELFIVILTNSGHDFVVNCRQSSGLMGRHERFNCGAAFSLICVGLCAINAFYVHGYGMGRLK